MLNLIKTIFDIYNKEIFIINFWKYNFKKYIEKPILN